MPVYLPGSDIYLKDICPEKSKYFLLIFRANEDIPGDCSMKNLYKPNIIIISLVALLCGCIRGKQTVTADAASGEEREKRYINLVLVRDTLKKKAYRDTLNAVLANLENTAGKATDPWYNYLRGMRYELDKKLDSALHYYYLTFPSSGQTALQTLKDDAVLGNGIGNSGIAKSEIVSRIMAAVKKAEQQNSIFTYRLYDLLAKSYYNNNNVEKAIEYTQQYFSHHPFRTHPVIRQRYYDISFMLAARGNNTGAMRQHLDSSRQLALNLHDSVALARTYDYESQYYSIKQEFVKGLECSRIYFNYFKLHNDLNNVVFNNLATSYVRAGKLDSAIYYYNECIRWAEQQTNSVNLLSEYQGLNEAYRKKGDYKSALAALNKAFNIYASNKEAIEAAKMEELHTQYQTAKKDQAIVGLQLNNELNKKVITQQRWIFVVICILLAIIAISIYSAYRQKLLREKNEKLLIENKRLLLEQKTRQMQLNPHFIYNAIANLQGLIRSDKKTEANAYLLAFSKLMRNILELNRHDLIPLDDEINSLRNYIKLQQMRFENMFEYSVDTGNLDIESLLIPPMLLQPFVENSVEHGFKSIGHKGNLTIRFRQEQTQLIITIDDNGAGKKVETYSPPEKESLSRIIIQERLDILFNKTDRQAYFEAGPKPQGTGFLVIVSIPLLIA